MGEVGRAQEHRAVLGRGAEPVVQRHGIQSGHGPQGVEPVRRPLQQGLVHLARRVGRGVGGFGVKDLGGHIGGIGVQQGHDLRLRELGDRGEAAAPIADGPGVAAPGEPGQHRLQIFLAGTGAGEADVPVLVQQAEAGEIDAAVLGHAAFPQQGPHLGAVFGIGRGDLNARVFLREGGGRIVIGGLGAEEDHLQPLAAVDGSHEERGHLVAVIAAGAAEDQRQPGGGKAV